MTEPGEKPRMGRGRHWEGVERQKDQILNVRAEAVRHLSPLERVIRASARTVAHPLFFAMEVVFHVAWIGLNTFWLPQPLRWDPYPYPLMTGLASTQALFIGLLILMHEERLALVSEVREETELQVNLHAEREATKLLRMMMEVHHALGIDSQEHDEELAEMAQPLDPKRLREATLDHLNEVERNA